LPIIVAGLAMVPSGLAMVAFAPVSGRLINRYGGRITLITGAAVMGLAYIGRVFFSDTVAAVVVGATVVSIGTAISYAAMPTLIMASVPITETASANGLNALLRALGTSSSSAAVAAVLGSVTIVVGSVALPSFAAFQDVFWMAGLGALASCAIAWYIPVRRAVAVGLEAPGGGLEAPGGQERATTEAGENREMVVHGIIRQADRATGRPAVVTVVKTDGTPVDWSRADNEGNYSVVLPGPGRYLVLANALGWAPHAQVLEFVDENTRQHITLTEQLTLSGRGCRGGRPLVGALITLSAATGEMVPATTACRCRRPVGTSSPCSSRTPCSPTRGRWCSMSGRRSSTSTPHRRRGWPPAK
jgi:MFS family permease